jgi:tetratricopeptide (TPR) repeat protein
MAMTNSPHHSEVAAAEARITPSRPLWREAASWLRSPRLWAAGLAVAAAVGLLQYLNHVKAFRVARPRANWASRPHLEAAIAAAQVRLGANPQDIAALVEIGMLHFEKGSDSYPEAVNELEEARRLGALDVRIFYCLGVMYQDMGLYPFAQEEYQKYLRNYPEDKEVRLLAAKLDYRQGDYVSAVREYERLRFRYPNDLLVVENLGLSLWKSKSMDRAVEVFEQLKAAGGLPARRADFYLGQIAFEAGRFQEGLDLMRRSLPAEGEADFGIPKETMFAAVAMACQKLKRPDEAREAWQKVLQVVPNDPKAMVALKDLGRRFPSRKTKRR